MSGMSRSKSSEDQGMAPDLEQVVVSKKSWKDLIRHAKKWRNLSSEGMSSSLHHLVLFEDQSSEDPKERVNRLFALGQGHQTAEQLLYTAKVPKRYDDESCTDLTVYVHSEPTFAMGTPPAELTDRCERQRTGTSWGVNGFQYAPATDTLLFSDAAGLVLKKMDTLVHQEVGSSVKGCKLYAQMCPVQSDLVAFVANRNIHMDKGGKVIHSTQCKGDISNGTPSFIMQEEFDRFVGMWWSPGPEKRLMYENVDESRVGVVQLACPGSPPTATMKYPKPGEPNAVSTLHMIEIDNDGVTDRPLSVNLHELYPWYEYMPRMGWVPDGISVWALLMNRRQNRQALVLIPVELFEVETKSKTDVKVGVTTLFDMKAQFWFNIDNVTRFLQNGDNGEIIFLHSTDQEDHHHINQFKVSITDEGAIVNYEAEPVTHGDWSVSKNVAPYVDEKRGYIYFVANLTHPTDSNLVVVSYRSGGSRTRVLNTEELSLRCTRADSELSLNPEIGFVCWESSLNTPPRCAFYRLQYPSHDSLPVSTLQHIIHVPHMSPSNDLALSIKISGGYPEIMEYESVHSSKTHYALLMHPGRFVEGRSYPVLQIVYGGPGIQLVRNMWSHWVMYQKFTSLGYVVLMVDGRGSANRGIEFESEVQKQMGVCEVLDQVEGLRQVASQRGQMLDLSRVAIMGWSYGGYLALMCLAKEPNVYRAAIAGGAVTEWTLYDTAYTERYLGRPADDWRNSSVLKYAQQLPNETGRLLIVHGLMDENVHFTHTIALIDQLVHYGKPFKLQVFPKERHGVRSSEASVFHDATVLDFLNMALTIRRDPSCYEITNLDTSDSVDSCGYRIPSRHRSRHRNYSRAHHINVRTFIKPRPSSHKSHSRERRHSQERHHSRERRYSRERRHSR